MKPRILILHASAGHGHKVCADAIRAEFARTHPDYNVALYDTLRFTPSLCGRMYSGVYMFLIRRLPILWAMLYNFHDVALLSTLVWPLHRLFNHCVTGKLIKYIKRTQPDAIICTHFMPTEVVGNLKRYGSYNGLLVTVITDFMPHYFWLNPHVDTFIAAHADTKAELQRRGIAEDKIVVSGIPVDAAFCASSNHAAAKQKMGIDPTSFCILLTGGGAGVGAVEDLCQQLCALPGNLHLVVVTGTNKKLYDILQSHFAGNNKISIQGFVHNMNEWLDACDLMIGKAGGLTVSETMAVGRPMILVNPVPGQEVLNAKLVARHGAGVWTHSVDNVISQVTDYINNPESLARMQSNAAAIGRPNAATDLIEFVAKEIKQSSFAAIKYSGLPDHELSLLEST